MRHRPRLGREGPGHGGRGEAVPGRAQVLRSLRRPGAGSRRYGAGLRRVRAHRAGPRRAAVPGGLRPRPRGADGDRPLGRGPRPGGLPGSGPSAPVPRTRQHPAGRSLGQRRARIGRERGRAGGGRGRSGGLPVRPAPVDPAVPIAAEAGLARGVGLPDGGRLPRPPGGFARVVRRGPVRPFPAGGLLLVEEDRARLLHRSGGRAGLRSGGGGRGPARTGNPGGAVPVPDVPGDGGVGVVALARAFVTGCRSWRAHQRIPYLFEATGRPRRCGRTASIQGSTSIRQPAAPGPVHLFGPPFGTSRSFFEKSRHSRRGGRSLLVRDGHGTGP